jgi:Fur family ferric uptake transcriptional regulator
MARPHYSGARMETTARESVREVLYGYLAGKGLRKTTQRDAIIEAAFSTREHFNAEELFSMAKKIDSSVSRATVYRTLPLLVESGLLRELDLGGETKIYDPNFLEHPTHNHLVCLDCKKIIEFEDINMELLENCITRRLGFSPANKMVKIEAHCDELKLRGTCGKRLVEAEP